MNKFSRIMAATIAVVAVGLTAHAGLDQYTSKNYTTILAPTPIGSLYSGGATTAATVAVTAVASNTWTDCVGLPGRGALVMSLNPGNGTAGGVVSISFASCATTNGTFATFTNASGVSSWSVTTTAAYVVAPIVPNAQSRYWRATATATAVTNGSVGAILVTE